MAAVKPIPTGQKNFVDLTGKQFGALFVVGYAGYLPGGAGWHCNCDCGAFKVVRGVALRFGKTKSCGCATGSIISAAITRHGYAKVGKVRGEFNVWRTMLARCSNPNHRGYADYGGRGIKVCQRWLKFENFIADVGDRPSGFTIERRNNDGNYCPSNCEWADKKTQAANRRKRRYWKRPK